MMKAFVEPPSGVFVESHVGSLLELRFVGCVSLDAFEAFKTKLVSLIRRIAEEKRKRAVLCTDLRACLLFRPEVSDRLVEMMKGDNPHIERNAFIGVTSALLSLQVQRYITETGGQTRRRMFPDESALIAWLSEVTTIREQARLRFFLNSNNAASPGSRAPGKRSSVKPPAAAKPR